MVPMKTGRDRIREATVVREVLLLHNTPKARRYFRTLASNISEPAIRTTPLLARVAGPRLDAVRAGRIADYSLRRKYARPWIPRRRLQRFERLYRHAAGAHYRWARHQIERFRPSAVGVWGGQAVDVRAARAAAADCGIPAFVFETGLLPRTTTCDPRGVNFDNSLPRDPAFYSRYDADSTLPPELEQRPPRRPAERAELPREYVFIPFQVSLDSQVLLYSPWIRDMRQLFFAVVEAWRAALGGAGVELVFKAHPSASEDHADLEAHARDLEGVRFANGNDAQELIDGALGVITLNSTVGIEALLRRRPVIALGQACYAIPGVVERAGDVEALGDWFRRLAADRLEPPHCRDAFLKYLANEYCVPDTHKAPGEAHFRTVAQRLAATPPRTSLHGERVTVGRRTPGAAVDT